MHREISHTDEAFHQESNLGLYLMTALLGLLIALDVLPRLGGWLGISALASFPQEIMGKYRFALVAAVLGGARILYTSLQSLFDGRIGADLALALACIAAILINEPLVAAEVVFIGMVGECLEGFTFARTQRAIHKLVEVFPRRCWVLRDGQEVRVLTSEVQVGDRVVVKPGAKAPVDGVIVDGRSSVDTSALTGESLPVDKVPGDEVLAGSVNQFGALTIEARRVQEHTVAGRVIELTARALKDKAPLERTADKLARFFLPAVLGLAALTFLGGMLFHGSGWFRTVEGVRVGWGQAVRLSIYPTLSVLVVACPCALILATPAAIIAALGRLAGTGVLIKGGSALERLAKVNAFAFDKTGTITEGRLELGDVATLGLVTSDELLRIAAAAEQRSEHPLARLILHEAQGRNLTLETVGDFLAHPGAGVEVQTSLGKVLVGTRRLLEEQGIPVAEDVLALLREFDAKGQTALLVARNGQVLGAIGARDRLRPEAIPVLAELRRLGITDIVLLTGDRSAAARALADDLGFSEIHAELLPEHKAEFIARWKESRVVAMVGDGINDAPALARADVGLAIGGTGADVAAEAGDIVFMGDPLRPLPMLVRLSRETVRIIRQNIIYFAFGVNAVGILLTAWLWPLFAPPGWYEQSPLAAVLYHQLGSLAVLLNSMRILWFERSAESPLMIRWRDRLQGLDSWLERYVNLDEFAHWLGHRWLATLGVLLSVVVVAYASLGLIVVAPDETAVVRRFGQPVEDLGPGWYWRWPWPVHDAARVSQRIRTVEIGFRFVPGKAVVPGALGWSSAHKREDRLADESMMITGDGDLVDVMAIIRFKVDNPRVYLFGVRAPEELIRASAESVLRGVVASRPFLDLLTIQRAAFQQEVKKLLERRCLEYGRDGLGVAIEGIALWDLHPPREVVEAYYEVAKAMEERDRLLNEAQERATRKLKTAESDQHRIVTQARAIKEEKIKQAMGELVRFQAKIKARKELDFLQEVRLIVESVDAVLGEAGFADIDEVESVMQKRRESLLVLQASLTDFRIFWDTLGQALTGRDLVLIDSDKIKGQRNFMLFDPDVFRVPVPIMMPPDRSLPPRSPFPPEGP